MLRILVGGGALLALAVVVLGAYVRLKDAGLGCPDWPGCYGQLVGVPDTDFAGLPIDRVKAWIEVAHRYFAGALGLLVLAMAISAWRSRAPAAQVALSVALFGAVLVQAGLGALTVTTLLKPLIVTAHLLGGMTILALLSAFAVRLCELPGFGAAPVSRRLSWLLGLAAVALVGQVALGGWVSSNYAGLSCGSAFPTCGGQWTPPLDTKAFALDRTLGHDASGAPLTAPALATVQWLHRLGAVAVLVAISLLAIDLWIYRRKLQATLLAVTLFAQIMLGIYIVVAGLPLPAALLHNAFAALLCIVLAAIASVAYIAPTTRQ